MVISLIRKKRKNVFLKYRFSTPINKKIRKKRKSLHDHIDTKILTLVTKKKRKKNVVITKILLFHVYKQKDVTKGLTKIYCTYEVGVAGFEGPKRYVARQVMSTKKAAGPVNHPSKK